MERGKKGGDGKKGTYGILSTIMIEKGKRKKKFSRLDFFVFAARVCAQTICLGSNPMSQFLWTSWSPHYLTTALLCCVRAPRLSALWAPIPDYPWSLRVGCESSDWLSRPDPIFTITAHGLGNVVTQLRLGRLVKVQEIWEMRVEVTGLGGRSQHSLGGQLVEGCWGKRSHHTYL